MACELPGAHPVDLNRGGDKAFAAEHSRHRRPRREPSLRQQGREVTQTLAHRGHGAVHVERRWRGAVDLPQIGLEPVDALALLAERNEQSIELSASRDGVGKVLRFALGRVEVSLNALAGNRPAVGVRLRVEAFAQEGKAAIGDLPVDEGGDGLEKGAIDGVLGAVTDAWASDGALKTMLVANVRDIVAALGARGRHAAPADGAPDE